MPRSFRLASSPDVQPTLGFTGPLLRAEVPAFGAERAPAGSVLHATDASARAALVAPSALSPAPAAKGGANG